MEFLLHESPEQQFEESAGLLFVQASPATLHGFPSGGGNPPTTFFISTLVNFFISLNLLYFVIAFVKVLLLNITLFFGQEISFCLINFIIVILFYIFFYTWSPG
jgi:hypothetical protein